MQTTRRRSGFEEPSKQSQFDELPATRSLNLTSELTIRLADVQAGRLDLAELRADGSCTYYSNFTPQGFTPPKCMDDKPNLKALYTHVLFLLLASKALVFTPEAVSMTVAGVVSLVVCSQNVLNWRFGMERSAVFVGLIFPLVFLIAQTWGRREQASVSISSIRGNGTQLVLKLLDKDPEKAIEAVEHIQELLKQIRHYLPQDSQGSRLRLASIYSIFSRLNSFKEEVLVRFIVCEFEKLRQIRNYRTPWLLNYFCFLFGNLAPIFFAPLFATVGCFDKNPARHDPDAHCGYGRAGAYISMVFFTTLLSALLGVVKALEDPFSLSGPDDLVCSFDLEGGALMDLIKDRSESKGPNAIEVNEPPPQADSDFQADELGDDEVRL